MKRKTNEIGSFFGILANATDLSATVSEVDFTRISSYLKRCLRDIKENIWGKNDACISLMEGFETYHSESSGPYT